MSGLGSALRRMDLTVARQAQMKEWIVVWNFIKKKTKKKNSSRSLPHERISQGREEAPQTKKDGLEGRLEVDTGV